MMATSEPFSPTRRTAMNTSSRLRRTLVPALVALLAGAVLTACNPDQIGSAAIVDGKPISSDTLQAATRDYLAAAGNAGAKNAQQRILQQMILARVVERAAKDQGVGVRTGAVVRQRNAVMKSVGGGRPGLVRALEQQTQTTVAPSQIDSWVRYRLRINRILAKIDPGGDPTSQVAADKLRIVLTKTSNEMDIQMNPRYGTWSPTRGVQPLISGGLSQTAAQLS
jgi:hypothetical protein